MRLSDIMSGMGLSSYAEVALVIFLAAFAVIATRLFFFSKRSELDHASRLPLEGDTPPPRSRPQGDDGLHRKSIAQTDSL